MVNAVICKRPNATCLARDLVESVSWENLNRRITTVQSLLRLFGGNTSDLPITISLKFAAPVLENEDAIEVASCDCEFDFEHLVVGDHRDDSDRLTTPTSERISRPRLIGVLAKIDELYRNPINHIGILLLGCLDCDVHLIVRGYCLWEALDTRHMSPISYGFEMHHCGSEVSTSEVGTCEVSPGDICILKARFWQIRFDEQAVGEITLLEAALVEVSTTKICTGEIEIAKGRLRKVLTGESQRAEINTLLLGAEENEVKRLVRPPLEDDTLLIEETKLLGLLVFHLRDSL